MLPRPELAEIQTLARELDRQTRESLELIRDARREPARPSGDRRQVVRPGDRPADETLLAFVHVPKTAGKTVTTMLAGAYTREAVRNAGNYLRNPEKTVRKSSMEKNTGGRVSVGHVPYGLFRESVPADTRFMTFLREPIDRVVSHFWRHILIKDPNRTPKAKADGVKVRTHTLQEAMVDHRLPALNNLMTRFLCDSSAPQGVLPASAVDEAKQNLTEFAFVGIQERFEESIVLLRRMLGVGSVPYETRHVNSDRPSVEELPDDEREMILDYNRLDAELYEFGRKLFDDTVAKAPAGFGAEVEALRKEGDANRAAAAAEADEDELDAAGVSS